MSIKDFNQELANIMDAIEELGYKAESSLEVVEYLQENGVYEPTYKNVFWVLEMLNKIAMEG